jgi:TonB-linked SusC/RagA family outer membrane protein
MIRQIHKKGTLILAFMLVFKGASLMAQDAPVQTDTVIVPQASSKSTLTGVITDAGSKKPIAGIRLEVGKFSVAITDANGKYSLKVPDYLSEVTVSGEGYGRRTVALVGRQTMDLALLDDSYETMNEPAATPFGLSPQRNMTQAQGTYDPAGWSINMRETPDALLQGRVAGVVSTRRSGTPSAGAELLIRGYHSLYATNQPLVVIDNMIFDINDYGISLIANNYTNPLSLIDPKDIDKITVLKEASSIYGSRGANGAIIITTVRAKEQATKIDFGVYMGLNMAPKSLPVMKADDYRIYLNDVLQSQGMSSGQIAAQPYMSDDPANPQYASYQFDTDWQDRVFQNSMASNYYIKVTGGDNIATYGLTMGYMQNEGIIKNTDFKRYNTRFNAEFNFSKKFTGYTNLSFTYNEQNLKDQGIADKTNPVFLGLAKAPFLNDYIVNAEGVQSPNLADRDTLGMSNPSAVIQNMQAYNKYYRFNGLFGFNYQISRSLRATTIFGVVYDKVRENIFVPSSGVAKDTLSNAIANNRLGTQVKRLNSFFNDTRLEYSRQFNSQHSLNSRLGIRYQKNSAEQDFALGFNSATDELVNIQNGLPSLRRVGGGLGEWNWMNIYYNADYSFRNKYLLSFNVAMDGSSRFGKEAQEGMNINGNKFPIFPSLSAAWLMSSEKFMANAGFDLFKIRASYSIAGNDEIGNYSGRQTYRAQNLLGMQGLVRNGIANPGIQWETTKTFNAGVDVSFWNERVSITADVYSSRISNMLVYEKLPAATGFSTVLTNNGSMENNGFDVGVNARLIHGRKLKWDLGFNIGRYKNTIGQVPGGSFKTFVAGATILTQNGLDPNLFYGYSSTGVFASDAEAANAGLRIQNADGSYSNFKGGDVRFNDLNNDRLIDENDQAVIGNPNPDFVGGINNRLIIGRFEFSALVTFSEGNDVFNYMRYRLEASSGYENQLVSVNNRWRGNGQVTSVPKASYNDPMGNARFSDRWIEDGSYIRLRSVSLQYTIPLKNKTIHNASIYANALNLFTLTPYKGYDPEFSMGNSIFQRGIDTGFEPMHRSVTLGVRLGL